MSAKEFLTEWLAHPEWWFSKQDEYDELICEKYAYLLDTNVTAESLVSQVVIYDQLPRHVYRKGLHYHIIEFFLQKALTVVYQMCQNNWFSEYMVDRFTPIEHTFLMLPLRHSKNPVMIRYALRRTWNLLENCYTNVRDEDMSIYKRFLRATYNNFLRDCASQEHSVKRMCVRTIAKSEYESVLAFSPNIDVQKGENGQLEFSKDIFAEKNTIIISLSGGVDSMVCSLLLTKQFPTKTLIAVHVNYNNRRQCDKEVLFLQDWCCKLGIPLFVRKINEVLKHRCVSFEMRDLYETYTRNVRYGTYKYVYGLYENDETPNVVLGHNRDDALENILTNIAHKNKYECLQGMTSIGVQDGVMFLRPLLKIPKETIIQFAKGNNIPYLPNSTPPMCQRGQIRNTVAPCLNAWHPQFIPSLFDMSDTLQSLFNIMETMTKSFIESGILIEGSSFERYLKLHELQEESMFWKKVISGLFGSYVSHRSVVNLIDNIRVYKKKFVKMNNNDTRKIHVSNDIYICLCKMRSGDLLLRINRKT